MLICLCARICPTALAQAEDAARLERIETRNELEANLYSAIESAIDVGATEAEHKLRCVCARGPLALSRIDHLTSCVYLLCRLIKEWVQENPEAPLTELAVKRKELEKICGGK